MPRSRGFFRHVAVLLVGLALGCDSDKTTHDAGTGSGGSAGGNTGTAGESGTAGTTGGAGETAGTTGTAGSAGGAGTTGAGGRGGAAGRGGGGGAGGRGGAAGMGGAAGRGGATGSAGSAGGGGAGTTGTGGSAGGGAGAGGSAGGGGATGTGGAAGTSGGCTPNTFRCVNHQSQRCDASGVWMDMPNTVVELVKNGSFDTSPIAWSELSGRGYFIITPPPSAFPIPPVSDPNVAFEGGYDNAYDSLFQLVTLPTNAKSFDFSFYYIVGSEEQVDVPRDIMYPYFRDTLGTMYKVVEISNLDIGTPGMPAWKHYTTQLPLRLAGGNYIFGFHTDTDDASPTGFYFDSVSLTASVCPF